MSIRDRLLALLETVDARELRRALGRHSLKEVEDLAGASKQSFRDTNAAPALAEFLIAAHSEAVFSLAAIRRGLLETLPEDQLAGLARRFTGQVRPKPYDNALALARLPWRAGTEWIEAFAGLFDIPYEYLPSPEPQPPTVETLEPGTPLGTLFDYQTATVRDLQKRLEPNARLLLQMPTGAGKTRVLVETLISVISSGDALDKGKSILWLAHSEELCEQAIQSFKRVWEVKGETTMRAIRAWGSRNVPPAAIRSAFIVCTLQRLYSLHRQEASLVDDLRKCLAIVVVDEAHKAIAPTYRQGIESMLGAGQMLLGLSATPGRSLDREDENRELVEMFADGLVRPPLGSNMVEELRERGILARVQRLVIESGVTPRLSPQDEDGLDAGGDFQSSVLKQLATNQERNALILDAVTQQVGRGRPTIVFACTQRHSALLSAALNMRNVPSRYVDSTMKKDLRWDSIRAYKNGSVDVLVNYGILTTGFDAPRTRTVVIGRPTNSVVLYGQMLGRALRGPRVGGASESIVIDVKDNFKRFGRIEHVLSVFDDYWTSN